MSRTYSSSEGSCIEHHTVIMYWASHGEDKQETHCVQDTAILTTWINHVPQHEVHRHNKWLCVSFIHVTRMTLFCFPMTTHVFCLGAQWEDMGDVFIDNSLINTPATYTLDYTQFMGGVIYDHIHHYWPSDRAGPYNRMHFKPLYVFWHKLVKKRKE